MSPDNPHGAPSPAEISVHIVGTDELKSRAAEVSEQRLEEKLAGDNEGRLKRSRAVVRRIWYGNMAREHYLSKYSRQAREEIKESGNLYVHADLDKQAHDEAMDATVMRFALESDDYIHEGEERGGGLEGESGEAVKAAIQDVIKAYARGDLTSEAFEEEKNRVMAELGKQYPDVFEEARLYADNLVGVAEAVKNQVQAGEDLDRVVEGVKFYIEKARTGVRTEAQLNAVDRLMDKLNDHHVFTNDAFVAGAVSIAYSVARYSARTTAGVLFKMAVVPGLSTGVMAGLTEKGRIKKERRHHMRERAQGAHFAPDAERREELEKTRYDTVSAMGLADQLHQEFTEVDAEGRVVEREMTDDEYNLMLDTLSDAMARVRMSDQKDVDLLDYSSIETVEHERLTLDLRIAQAKIALQNQLGGRRSLDASLEDKITTKMEALSEDVENKDLLFRKLKRGAVAKAVARGVILGATFGTISHELLSVVRPDEHGLLDSVIHHDKPAGAHQTLLRHMFLGDHHKQILDSSDPHAQPFGDGTHMVKLPDNIHLRSGGNGGYALEGPGHQMIADHINFNPDGSLDDPSKAMLDHMGITSSSSLLRAPSGVVAEHSVSTGDYVAHHAEKMTHIKRDGWSDNDTPMHYDAQGRLVGADQNELRVLWGGSNGSGIDEQGNYVLDVSHMTSDGSFHAGVGVDAASEMQSGRLVAMVSASKDSQQLAFETHINTQGQLVIDHGSDPGHLFQTVDGHAQFNGAYIEIAKINGVEDGITHVNVLATHVGENTGQVTDTVPGPDISRYVTTLRNFPRASSARPLVDVPWMVPQGRKGLETAMKPVPEPENTEGGTPSTPETPLPELEALKLFDLKEVARDSLEKLMEMGDITPLERRRFAGDIGRITERMGDNTVTENDLMVLYSSIARLHDLHPELISDQVLDQMRKTVAAAGADIPNQADRGWYRGPYSYAVESPSPAAGTPPERNLIIDRTRPLRRIVPPVSPTSTVTPPETPPEAPTGPEGVSKTRQRLLDGANEAFSRLVETNPTLARALDLVDGAGLVRAIRSSDETGPDVTRRGNAVVVRGDAAFQAVNDYFRLRESDGSGLSDANLRTITERLNSYRELGVNGESARETIAPEVRTPEVTGPEQTALDGRNRLLGLASEALEGAKRANPVLRRAIQLVEETDVDNFRLSPAAGGPNIVQDEDGFVVRDPRTFQAIRDYLALREPDNLPSARLRRIRQRLERNAVPVENEGSSGGAVVLNGADQSSSPGRSESASAATGGREEGEIRFSHRESPRDLSEREMQAFLGLIASNQGREVGARLARRGLWRREERADGSPVFLSVNKPRTQRVFAALGQTQNNRPVEDFQLPILRDEGSPIVAQHEVGVPLPNTSLNGFKNRLRAKLRDIETPDELWGFIRGYERAGLINRHPWGQPDEIPGIEFEIIGVGEFGELAREELIRANSRLRKSGAYNQNGASNGGNGVESNPEAG